MKVFISTKTIEKLKGMLESGKSDSISVRKFGKGDNPSNVFKGIKLTEQQRHQHKSGKAYSIYVSKDRLKEVKKIIDENPDKYGEGHEGGFLPLLPIILGIIGAVSTAAGATTGIVKTILDSKTKNSELAEENRHNLELEKTARGEAISLRNPSHEVSESQRWKNGSSLDVKNFVNNTKLDDVGKRTVRSFLKNLSDTVEMKYDGSALSLRPLR